MFKIENVAKASGDKPKEAVTIAASGTLPLRLYFEKFSYEKLADPILVPPLPLPPF